MYAHARYVTATMYTPCRIYIYIYIYVQNMLAHASYVSHVTYASMVLATRCVG